MLREILSKVNEIVDRINLIEEKIDMIVEILKLTVEDGDEFKTALKDPADALIFDVTEHKKIKELKEENSYLWTLIPEEERIRFYARNINQ